MSDISDIFDKVKDLPDAIKDVYNKVKDLPDEVQGIIDDIKNLKDVPQDVKTALKNLSDLTKVALDIPTILDKVREAPDKLKSIFDDIEAVGKFFGAIQSTGGVLFKNLLLDFFRACDDILKNPIDKLVSGNPQFVKATLTTIATYLAQIAADLSVAVVGALDGTGLSSAVASVAKRVAAILDTLSQAIINVLTSALSKLSDLPSPLVDGPAQAFSILKDLTNWANGSNGEPFLKDRREVAASSISSLTTLVGGAPQIPALSNCLMTIADDMIKWLGSSQPATEAVYGIIGGAVFPTSAFSRVFDSASTGKLWAWIETPHSLLVGNLTKWINDETTYFQSGSAVPLKRALERSFRTKLVNAGYSYFQGRVGNNVNAPKPVRQPGSLTSAVGLADVVSMFADVVFEFLFESWHATPIQSDLLDFECIGVEFANFFSSQVEASIRSSVGLLLRGIWLFSVQNDVLIELIASVLGTYFGAIYNAIIRNLACSFRIVSKYTVDTPVGWSPIIPSWRSSEPILTEGPLVNQCIEYSLLSRDTRTISQASITSSLKNVLSDYTTFLESAYYAFRWNCIFADSSFETWTPAMIVECSITEAKVLHITVNAIAPPSGEPVSVLRVCFLNYVLVVPYDVQHQQYQLIKTLTSVPNRAFNMTFVTSRGGRLTRQVLAVP